MAYRVPSPIQPQVPRLRLPRQVEQIIPPNRPQQRLPTSQGSRRLGPSKGAMTNWTAADSSRAGVSLHTWESHVSSDFSRTAAPEIAAHRSGSPTRCFARSQLQLAGRLAALLVAHADGPMCSFVVRIVGRLRRSPVHGSGRLYRSSSRRSGGGSRRARWISAIDPCLEVKSAWRRLMRPGLRQQAMGRSYRDSKRFGFRHGC